MESELGLGGEPEAAIGASQREIVEVFGAQMPQHVPTGSQTDRATRPRHTPLILKGNLKLDILQAKTCRISGIVGRRPVQLAVRRNNQSATRPESLHLYNNYFFFEIVSLTASSE